MPLTWTNAQARPGFALIADTAGLPENRFIYLRNETIRAYFDAPDGSFGRPRTRSATMFRSTSSVPPAMRIPDTPST